MIYLEGIRTERKETSIARSLSRSDMSQLKRSYSYPAALFLECCCRSYCMYTGADLSCKALLLGLMQQLTAFPHLLRIIPISFYLLRQFAIPLLAHCTEWLAIAAYEWSVVYLLHSPTAADRTGQEMWTRAQTIWDNRWSVVIKRHYHHDDDEELPRRGRKMLFSPHHHHHLQFLGQTRYASFNVYLLLMPPIICWCDVGVS